ncbi:MAG: TRCF domain-containing protein [Chromatiales bacterium]
MSWHGGGRRIVPAIQLDAHSATRALLPQSTKDLFRITRLKRRAAPLGVRKIDLGAHSGRVLFHAQAEVDPLALVKLMQTQLHTYKFEQGGKIRITASLPDGDAR